MRNSPLKIMLATLLSLWISQSPLHAQNAQKAVAQESPGSIQHQINELKEGQERVLKELGEIKKLLQEKSGRVDYAAKPAVTNVISLNVHGEPFRGESQARVAIMEYSDFDCSFCAKFVHDIYPKINEDYIKPGKIKYFFRDLPESGQTNSWVKACAARCAGEQGKFWQMHDLLFAAQSISTGQDTKSSGEALGLDMGKFDECLSSGRYSENIRRSIAGAGRMRIFGTPAFVIGTLTADGEFLRTTKIFLGAESYTAFKSVLDEMLISPAPTAPKK